MLFFYVPLDHAERVKQALFDLGVGKLGHYDCCAWQSEGMGQFRGLEGSHAFVGKKGEIHREKEVKVEMFCESRLMPQALELLVKVHPYEEPAYYVLPVGGELSPSSLADKPRK